MEGKEKPYDNATGRSTYETLCASRVIATQHEVAYMTDYDYVTRANIWARMPSGTTCYPVITWVERDAVFAFPGEYPIVFHTGCQNRIQTTVLVKAKGDGIVVNSWQAVQAQGDGARPVRLQNFFEHTGMDLAQYTILPFPWTGRFKWLEQWVRLAIVYKQNEEWHWNCLARHLTETGGAEKNIALIESPITLYLPQMQGFDKVFSVDGGGRFSLVDMELVIRGGGTRLAD